MSSVLLIQKKNEGTEEVWAEKGLQLLRCFMKKENSGKELALVQNMECVLLFDNVDEALWCFEYSERLRLLGRKSMMKGGEDDREALPARECFRVTSFQNSVRTLHVVRASISVHPSTTKLHGRAYRFHINKFF